LQTGHLGPNSFFLILGSLKLVSGFSCGVNIIQFDMYTVCVCVCLSSLLINDGRSWLTTQLGKMVIEKLFVLLL